MAGGPDAWHPAHRVMRLRLPYSAAAPLTGAHSQKFQK